MMRRAMSFRDLFGDRFGDGRRKDRLKSKMSRYRSDLCLATILQGIPSRTGNAVAPRRGGWWRGNLSAAVRQGDT